MIQCVRQSFNLCLYYVTSTHETLNVTKGLKVDFFFTSAKKSIKLCQ